MEDEIRNQLIRILPSLKALAESVERNLYMNLHQGTGGVTAKSYRALHGKIVQLFPDDTYITEALALDTPDDLPDDQKVAAVQVLLKQLEPDFLREVARHGRVVCCA